MHLIPGISAKSGNMAGTGASYYRSLLFVPGCYWVPQCGTNDQVHWAIEQRILGVCKEQQGILAFPEATYQDTGRDGATARDLPEGLPSV